MHLQGRFAPHRSKKIKGAVYAGKRACLSGKRTSFAGSGSKNDRVEALLFQIAEAEIGVFADTDVAYELHAHELQPFEVGVNYGRRKAILGNAVTQHTARFLFHFEYGYGIACHGKIPCCGKSGGA